MFISTEALLILLASYAFFVHPDWIQVVAQNITITPDLLKALTIFPLGLAGWIFLESKKLVFEREAMAKLLIEWPDYWKLKQHIYASILYAIIFAMMSIAPWFLKQGASAGLGFVTFLLGILGQLLVAANVYLAGFKLQELGIDAPK